MSFGKILASTFLILIGLVIAVTGVIVFPETFGIVFLTGALFISIGFGVEGSFFKALPFLTGRK